MDGAESLFQEASSGPVTSMAVRARHTPGLCLKDGLLHMQRYLLSGEEEQRGTGASSSSHKTRDGVQPAIFAGRSWSGRVDGNEDIGRCPRRVLEGESGPGSRSPGPMQQSVGLDGGWSVARRHEHTSLKDR